MSKFINFIYILLWILSIFVFAYLIKIILESENNMIYISALAILLSAFLASTSVLKSIHNTNTLNSKTSNNIKNTNIIQVDFLLLDIYRQINFLQNELSHILDRHKQLKENKSLCSPIKEDANEYFLKTITDRKKQLLKRLNQLEDKEILYALDEGQRIILLKISNDISTLEYLFNHIENSANTNIIETLLTENKPLFERIIKCIDILKNDIQKQNKELEILSLEEYKNDYNT